MPRPIAIIGAPSSAIIFVGALPLTEGSGAPARVLAVTSTGWEA